MSGKLKDSHLFCSYTESGNLRFFPVKAEGNANKIYSTLKIYCIGVLNMGMRYSEENYFFGFLSFFSHL